MVFYSLASIHNHRERKYFFKLLNLLKIFHRKFNNNYSEYQQILMSHGAFTSNNQLLIVVLA